LTNLNFLCIIGYKEFFIYYYIKMEDESYENRKWIDGKDVKDENLENNRIINNSRANEYTFPTVMERKNAPLQSQNAKNLYERLTNSTIPNRTDNKEIAQNIGDAVTISVKENEYLKKHETMDKEEYDKLFSWGEEIQQWDIWDCYLITWIYSLSKASHFDTLVRTSIKRETWEGKKNWISGYSVKIPFWEPNWHNIFIKDSELSVARIRWNDWYKILELVYAKDKLSKWKSSITSADMKKIEWWWTHEVLERFLWLQNVVNTQNYKNGTKPLQNLPKSKKDDIIKFLKGFNLNIGNKFISLWTPSVESDREDYWVWQNSPFKLKRLFYNHCYSLKNVNKDDRGEVKSVTVRNPWNSGGYWEHDFVLTIDEFFAAFSDISTTSINKNVFLDDK